METSRCNGSSQEQSQHHKRSERSKPGVEIGVRFLFENFTYKFAKESYKQESGGPIGARVTMAAAHIVMKDCGAKMERHPGNSKHPNRNVRWICG